ncbi:MAG: hypothetical protein E7663_05565 [Ruminococcaceae bacterium]|nr:hypothetical protein [Oscillospiraceae bacterium]
MAEIKKATPVKSRTRAVRGVRLAAKAADHKAAPQKLKMLITVVDRNKTEFYMDLIQSFGVNMQFCASAKGTASSEILSIMGLEEREKKVIFSVIREEEAPRALRMLEKKFATIKNGKGIAMTVPLSSMIGVSLYRFLSDNRKGG